MSIETQEQQIKNKAGRKKLPYNIKPLNIRIDTRLIDRMNEDKVDKTALIHKLLRAHYNVQE